ncbi:hypothetical protein Q427_28675 [Halomonas sp. BC04]|nr:hypothetical protein Q427_28675 [Halomonas sp. BC04]
MIEPVDPLQGSELNGFQMPPWSAPADHLRLEQSDHSFGQRPSQVIVPCNTSNIEMEYNSCRLHSTLGYQTPREIELAAAA